MKKRDVRNRASRFHLRLNQPLGLIRARVRLGLGGGNLGGDFSSEVVNALFDAFTNDEERVAADLGAGSLHEFADGLLVVLDERLVDERDFLEELLDRTFGDAFEHGFRLAGFAGLFDGDAAFGSI